MNEKNTVKLTRTQKFLLLEAARRYLKFNDLKQDLRHAWVGLGTPSQYAPMYEAGLMKTHDGEMTPRIRHWWVLTEKGAALVQDMINQFALVGVEKSMGINPDATFTQYALFPII